MAKPSVVARLRVTPSMGVENTEETITLEQVDADYRVVVKRKDGSLKQQRHVVAVSPVLVSKRLAALKKLTVPAFPTSPMVCDGAHVEMHLNGENSTVTISWWTIPPKGAEGLAEFADWLYEVGSSRE